VAEKVLWSIESQRFRGREPLNVCHEGPGAKIYTLCIIIARSSKYKVMECRVHGKDAEARFFE
jgi:hypothetical protein